MVKTNVAKKAKNRPKVRASDDMLKNVWNADEASAFLEAVRKQKDAQWSALFATALDGGIRKGEMLG
jgi:integrase